MIKELTPEQVGKFEEYVKKYTQIGLTTIQRTQAEAERDFNLFQTKVLKKSKPDPVILLKSPSACWAAVTEHVLKNTTTNKA